MKKIFLLLLVLFAFLGVQAQCVIDNNNTNFVSPRPDSLPCVERTVFYDQTIQYAFPSSINLGDFIPNLPFPYVLTIDSVVIDTVYGLPNGINYVSNPAGGKFKGGQKACALMSGTTTDPAGSYPLEFSGYMRLKGFPIPGIFGGDTIIDFSVLQSMGGGQAPQLDLEVIEQGAECSNQISSSVKESDLFSSVKVYPNPNKGVFHLELNAERNAEASIAILDITGRNVFSETVTMTSGFLKKEIRLTGMPSGIYLLKIHDKTGTITRKISVE